MVRNDLCGRQYRSIGCEMGVGCQRHIVAERNRTAASRIDTVFGLGSHNDELANPGLLKLFRQAGLEERVGCLLSDDGLPTQRKNRRMDRPRRGLCFEGMPLGTVVLDEEDGRSRRARLAQQKLDIRQHMILHRRRHKPHQANLNIDDEQRGFQLVLRSHNRQEKPNCTAEILWQTAGQLTP